MNILKALLLLALILTAAQVFAADTPRSPEEQAVVDADARATAARKALIEKQELAKAQAKAEWNSKSLGEAWAIRGQTLVDATQWTGGRALQYTAKADANVVHYGFTVPAAYVASTAASIASGAQSYADGAFDNRPKTEVALKVGDAEVKASVPTPAAK